MVSMKMVFVALSTLALGTFATQMSEAQTATPTPTSSSNVLQVEGIAGDVDKYHRSPLLSVSTQVSTAGVKILADTAILNQQFSKYPVQVDFYVNRRLFASQIRSPELPGPLGVDVGKEAAPAPFNYTVVATLLHPNRTFTTVLQGAVFSTSLTKNYDCTLVFTAPTETNATTYFADNITAAQTSNNTFSLTFSALDDSGTKQVSALASVTVSGESASGTASITDTNNTTNELSLSGTAVSTGGSIESFELAQTSTTQALNCSLSQ